MGPEASPGNPPVETVCFQLRQEAVARGRFRFVRVAPCQLVIAFRRRQLGFARRQHSAANFGGCNAGSAHGGRAQSAWFVGRQQRRLVAIAVAVPHSPQRTALGRQQLRRRHIAAIAVAIARSARATAALRTLFTDIPSLTHFRTPHARLLRHSSERGPNSRAENCLLLSVCINLI